MVIEGDEVDANGGRRTAGDSLRAVLAPYGGDFADAITAALIARHQATGSWVTDSGGAPLRIDYRLDHERAVPALTLRVSDATRPSTAVSSTADSSTAASSTVVSPTAVPEGRSQLRDLAAAIEELNQETLDDEVLERFVRHATAAAGATTGAVFRVTGSDRAEVVAVWGATRRRGYPYPAVPVADVDRAGLLRQPQVRFYTSQDALVRSEGLRSVSCRRLRQLAVVPAFSAHRPMALLVLTWTQRQETALGLSWLLQSLGDALGTALGRAMLLRQTDQSEAALQTAVTVARAIARSLDLDKTFREIAGGAARVLGECECLLLERRESDSLLAVATSDRDNRRLLGLRVTFEDFMSIDEALEGKRSIVVRDAVWGVHADRELRERLRFRCAIFLPIVSESGLFGCLLLYSTGRRASFSAEELRRAEAVAEQAASAIVNARLYQNLRASQETTRSLLERITDLRERRSLTFASLLHDHIVQPLVAAAYALDECDSEAPDGVHDEVARIADLLRSTVEDARTILAEERPPVLDNLGLKSALRLLLDRLPCETSSDISLDAREEQQLPRSVSTALYVVAREAVRNARLHALAAHVSLALRIGDAAQGHGQAVMVSVADDGCGFDPDAVDKREHFGLTMMDEQMGLVGGRLTVESSSGHGTTVTATVPLAPPSLVEKTDRGAM